MFSLFSISCCCCSGFFNFVGDNSNDLVGGGRIGDRGSCTGRRVKGFLSEHVRKMEFLSCPQGSVFLQQKFVV